MRYFLWLLGVVALIVLVVLVIRGGSNPATNTGSGPKVVKLTDYITKNSEVRLTTDGQLNGEEDHRVIQISVTPNSRSLTVFTGYNQQVLKQENFPNDGAAYDNFLRALSLLGYVKERAGVKQTDERGVCPTGDRYIYELREDDKAVKRLWSTSCNTAQGTFAGTAATARILFQKQIPDYNKFTGDVQL